ncbi:hypothetical protein WR25_16283 [Diploscapter pachys]|uniref:Glycosyltransferase family 92 protein n=1 Tax=Diploscapter pachys TaxID=2018661 RepID=A0A2A2L8J2_9BILA|nr:hypothetical protein WR25_16283 [Diploscapter pachys]
MKYGKMGIKLLSAFEYVDHIAIQITALNKFGLRMYCHYYDSNQNQVGEPYESVVFPESITYCERRPGVKFVSLTEKLDDEPQYPVPLIDRTKPEPEHFFSICVASFYGKEAKWLMIAEFIEFYKLQGATHFYFYIHQLSLYDRKILEDYQRTGDVDITIIDDRYKRGDKKWHHTGIFNCVLRSRYHSKWAAIIDIDERLTMTEYNGTIADYLREIDDDSIGSIQFRQRWIMKTELQPEKYINEKEIIKWMPTQRYTNTSHVGSVGHTAKCIIQPTAVIAMGVHNPYKFYPGYRQYRLAPKEGVVRHYRDLYIDGWNKRHVKTVAKFGKFEETTMAPRISERLVDAVVKRVKFVYGRSQE